MKQASIGALAGTETGHFCGTRLPLACTVSVKHHSVSFEVATAGTHFPPLERAGFLKSAFALPNYMFVLLMASSM